jgi:hypothetical protein
VNRVFTLLILSFVGWNAGELIMINSDTQSMALVGVKIIFVGVFLFPVFFLHFSYVFPQKLTRFFDGWRAAILYVGPVGVLVPFILLLQVDIGRVLKIGSIFYYIFAFKGPRRVGAIGLCPEPDRLGAASAGGSSTSSSLPLRCFWW